MLSDLMQHYSLVRDLYLVLPEEVGATVHNAVTSALLSIMMTLLAVTRSLSDLSDKGSVTNTQATQIILNTNCRFFFVANLGYEAPMSANIKSSIMVYGLEKIHQVRKRFNDAYMIQQARSHIGVQYSLSYPDLSKPDPLGLDMESRYGYGMELDMDPDQR